MKRINALYALMLVIVLFPSLASAQTCATSLTGPATCNVDVGAMSNKCIKRLVSSQNCAIGPAMAGTKGTAGTYFKVGMGITYLYCRRPTAVTGTGFCSVACDCGALVINNSDGLPVELMEFSIGE